MFGYICYVFLYILHIFDIYSVNISSNCFLYVWHIIVIYLSSILYIFVMNLIYIWYLFGIFGIYLVCICYMFGICGKQITCKHFNQFLYALIFFQILLCSLFHMYSLG